MAQGASLMTGATWTSRIVGAAWPQHFSKPVAEAMFTNVQRVGLPKWSEDDQAFAKAVQKEIEAPLQSGLDVELDKLGEPIKDEDKRGGGSDDIGDVSWTVPTVMLRYPANIPGLPGHNWANGIAMATPIAHKGVVAGAKVQAMTMVDILLRPELVKSAWEFPERAVEGHEIYALHRRRHASPHVGEQGHDGTVPGAEEVLLRSVAIRDVSRAVGRYVSDAATGGLTVTSHKAQGTSPSLMTVGRALGPPANI